ncbi:hypothetical protein P0M28_19320 [Tunicatimonas pelagia]|nr:hypothetical protein [Tunicatimonas pelagia]WKN41189.1 hypothetical protein P0M28_19320 [Tunicatimonas pelagia]
MITPKILSVFYGTLKAQRENCGVDCTFFTNRESFNEMSMILCEIDYWIFPSKYQAS